MVNRSVAKRAKHAKPALRKGYWAKSSSSVLAVALAASLVPAVPALGDEFDADVSDIEATEPPAFDAPIPTEPSSTAPDALAELEAGDRATSVDSKSDAGNKGALPESGGAEGVGDRTFGEVDDAGFREGLGAEALAAAEVQEESSGQGSSTTRVPEGPENSWRYEDGVALGSLGRPRRSNGKQHDADLDLIERGHHLYSGREAGYGFRCQGRWHRCVGSPGEY